MGWFGGDPGAPVLVAGKETFPLVPVAVGVFSTGFNIFNTLLLFPFVGTFERVLLRIGRTAAEDIEDYSVPKFLSANCRATSPMPSTPFSTRSCVILMPQVSSSASRAPTIRLPGIPMSTMWRPIY